MASNITKTLALGATLFIMLVGAKSYAKSYDTIENLNKAYVIEANAWNMYSKYSDKAAQEGYTNIAKLFRAAAFFRDPSCPKPHDGHRGTWRNSGEI